MLADDNAPTDTERPCRRRATALLSALVAAGLVLGLTIHPAGLSRAKAAEGGPPAVPVVAATPLKTKVTSWDEFTGRLEAVESVEVRPRVSGFIEAVHFKDGQIVAKGDLLFTIDQSPFLIQAEAARAEVASARAQVALADAEVGRANALLATRAGTQSVLDQRRASLNVARADLQAAQAAVKEAELNLEWTKVTAPLAGRISDAKVDVGNLVAGNQITATPLATIVSLNPIHVAFEASEADYIRYARLVNNGDRASSRENATPVRVRLSDETAWTRKGVMDFVDNQLNPRSGTIRGRAILDNKDQFLIPGTFVRLQVFGGEGEKLLVPDAAVVSDQTRKILLVVGAGDVVEPRVVRLGPMAFGLRVIEEGLKPDDRVIIEGLANPFVRPGSKVIPNPGKIERAGEG